MGCGGSRPENRADVLPAKLRPLLWKRYEEMKRQKNAGILKDSPNHSKKELLKDGVSDGDNSSNHHSPRDNDRGSSSSQEDDVRVAPARNAMKQRLEMLRLPRLDKQDSKHGEDGEDKTLEAMDTAMKTVNEIEMGVDQNEQDSELEDEEEGRLRSMDESCICPGSPSFRVYFIESSTNTDDEDKDDDTDKKSSSDQESSEIIESLSGAIEKKKGKRGRRFRVIPKGKNLLNVKSCYYPSCSGGHDKARLLGQ
ncbi:nucleolin [Salix suchowensis]|nr:nucleolin [Salix suchowensis]